MKNRIEILHTLTGLAYPPIYNLAITGLPEYNAQLCFWGWVDLGDLTRCINYLLSKKQITETIKPADIFTRYGLVCGRDVDQPQFTWVKEYEYAINSTEPPDNPLNCYIPAGWAERVIKLANSGILKVTSSPAVIHQTVGEAPQVGRWAFPGPTKHITFLGPFVRHQVMGHKHDGTKCIVSMGEGSQTTQEAPSMTILW